MKKILFITLLLSVSISTFGQMVSSSSLVVTKTKIKKQLPEVKPGYEQSVDVAYTYFFYDEMGIDLNYIGGWRFNRMFYAGLGTGLYFNLFGYGTVRPKYDGDCLEVQTVNVPLYAHGRVYFTKKHWMPFIALSIGGTFSTPRKGEANYDHRGHIYPFSYSTCRFLLNPMVGIDYRITENLDFYLSLGYRGMTRPEIKSLNEYALTIGQEFVGALDLHIGFTF